MPRSLIALGANLGDRAATLSEALDRLSAVEGVAALVRSRWIETAPIGGPSGQPPFLNGAAIVETTLDPESFRRRLEEIETELGRKRLVRWDARAIDLDVLLYEDRIVDTPQLIVPHPRMAVRRFVLEPAAEIAGDWVHPTIGWTIEKLWRHLIEATPYLAVAGSPAIGKSQLAKELTSLSNARLIAAPPPPDAIAAASDSSGPAVAREIEFLARRQHALARQTWDRPNAWAVSDFWFDQSLAWAAVSLDQADWADVHEAWQRAQETIVRPKLLVVLKPGAAADGSESQAEAASVAQESAAERRKLSEELDRLARRPGIGPVLWLSVADWQATVREASAALASMQ